MAFTGQRWIGRAIQAPCLMGTPSAGGRHTYYGAMRLAGGGEVGLNDIVQVCRPGEISDGIPQLAQVLSMWEDVFTGECNFRARWLAHSSGLPEEVLLRFRAARQRCEENGKSDQGRTPPSGERLSPGTDEDEFFLTAKQEDLLLTMVVEPATVGVPGTSPGKSGPRLNLAYDDDSREFTPLESTHPVVARALARQAEAIAEASRGSDGTTVSGWLLPRGGAAFDGKNVGNADESVRNADDSAGDIALSSTPDTETEEDSSDGDSVGAEDPVSAGAEEWDRSGQEDGEGAYESDRGGEIGANSPSATTKRPPVGSSGRGYATPVKMDLFGECRSSPRRRDKAMANGFPRARAALAPPHGSSGIPGSNFTGSPLPPRSRRLAMPAAEADEACPAGANHSPLNPAARYSMRARQSIGIGARSPRALPVCGKRSPAPAQSKRLLSGKRKRAIKLPDEGSESEEEYPPRRTPVGDDFQVDIPDLLPVEEREEATAVVAAAAAAGEESGAKMIWRSIRDWDPHTRGMLAGYLQAAKAVVRTRQSRPGIAVHIRMGGKDAGKCTTKGSGSTESFAAWALTATPGRGTSACGIVRIACPANAQTEVPPSAIQRVQYEEEALEALQSTSPMLDDFEPALHMLADSEMSPESLQPWTLDQVGILEAALHKDLDPDEGLHGIDREDSIDLTKIIKEVPGKSPGQVLFFYYRYLAAARPLIDVVYGPEAAKTRKGEVSAGGDSDVEVTVAPRRDLARLTPPGTSPTGNGGTRESMVDQNLAPLGLSTAAGRPHGDVVGNSGADGAGQLGHPGGAELGAGLLPYGAEAGGGNDPDARGSTPTPTPSNRGLGVPVAQPGQESPSLWGPASGPAAGLSNLGRPTDEVYGFMAPCWRLLDQAQPYVNRDQLVYLEGLIFRHLKSPLSRCQLLGRVKSCLEGQHDVYADFVRMFDRVEQHPIMPPRPSATTIPDGPSSEAYIPLTAEPAHGSRFFPPVAARGIGHVGPHQWPVPPYVTHDYGYGAMQGRVGSLFHPPPPPLLPTRPPQGCHDDTYAEHEQKPRHWEGGPKGGALSGQEKPGGAPGPPGPAWESEGAGGPAAKH